AFRRRVRGHWIRLAESLGGQARRGNTALDQPLTHRVGAALRKLLVVRVGADAVRVAVAGHVDVRLLLQDRTGLLEDRYRIGPNVRLVEVEVHTAQQDLLLGSRRARRRRGGWGR